MRALLDTNILARAVQPVHPMHAAAMEATERLRKDSVELCVAGQRLFELYVVATRPIESNGMGVAVLDVLAEMKRLSGVFTLLPESPATYPIWFELMTRYQVRGKAAHDGRLVALAIANQIDLIVTFNVSDFTRYVEMKVATPDEIVQGRYNQRMGKPTE